MPERGCSERGAETGGEGGSCEEPEQEIAPVPAVQPPEFDDNPARQGVTEVARRGWHLTWPRIDVDVFRLGFVGGAIIGGTFALALNFSHLTANILAGAAFSTQVLLSDLLDVAGIACVCGFLGGFVWNWVARGPEQ